jgi:catechol 2,3-dioxygenase-like lactoylglutathione lyase family enzyme
MLSDGQAAATLAVSDMDRAKKFYTDTLGFAVQMESEGGMLLSAGKGTAIFVYPSSFAGTNKATGVSFNVDDFDATIADLRTRGVEFIEYDFPGLKTENGVAQTPEGPGAWFADPDGNLIAVTSMSSM